LELIMSRPKTTGANTLSASFKRKLGRSHRQMDADERAGPVQPPPVRNRRTGRMHQFGSRRALDGAWMLELLAAAGCTHADYEGALYVLDMLLEFHVPINRNTVALLHSGWEMPPPRPRRRLRVINGGADKPDA
jgi:hypothetical protein